MSVTVIDRRGQPKGEPCRVCGCAEACHSQSYNKPTMGCIEWLRNRIKELEGNQESLTNHILMMQEQEGASFDE